MGPERAALAGPARRLPFRGSAPVVQDAAVAVLLLALLAVLWWINYSAGGSRTVLTHLFYLPVIVAAVRFEWPGAVVVALTAMMLAGPLLPADVEAGESQALWNWTVRGVVFLLVGLTTAFLTRRDSRSARSVVHDARIASSLREALRRNRLDVHYQPILDLAGGGMVGVEALARWKRPGHGDVSPAVFVPVAERTGLIAELDRYVLDRAVRDMQAWQVSAAGVSVSVNVSATWFSEPRLLADVDEVLARTNLEPALLQLEITETGIIPDVEASAAQIAALRERGVRVAIDDFGAGQTSLSYFNEFTVDTVKIDRAFVTRSVAQPQTARVLGALISLFDSLGVHVVAEGISSAEEYLELLSLQCESGQGFYLGRPMSAPDLSGVLRAQCARSLGQPPAESAGPLDGLQTAEP